MIELGYVVRYVRDIPRFYDLESFDTVIEPDQRASLIEYNAARQEFLVSHRDESARFGRDTLEREAQSYLRFEKSAGSADLGGVFEIGSRPTRLKYSMQSTHSFSEESRSGSQAAGELHVERRFLPGSPTVLTDLPTSGISLYTAELNSSAVRYGASGSPFFSNGASIRIDHGTGEVTGTIEIRQTAWLAGTAPEAGRITLAGRITPGTTDIAGTISGSLHSTNLTGQFIGRLFGPKGVEAGFLFVIKRDQPESPDHRLPIIGHVAAWRG